MPRPDKADLIEQMLSELRLQKAPIGPDVAFRNYFSEWQCSGHGQFNGRYCRDAAGPDRWCINCAGIMLRRALVAAESALDEARKARDIGYTEREQQFLAVVDGLKDWQRRACQAIEQAITNDDGLDGLDGEALLREVSYWPSPVRVDPPAQGTAKTTKDTRIGQPDAVPSPQHAPTDTKGE
jgi:hypothetical protein